MDHTAFSFLAKLQLEQSLEQLEQPQEVFDFLLKLLIITIEETAISIVAIKISIIIKSSPDFKI